MLKSSEKKAIEDLRFFSESLITTGMLDLRAAMEHPKQSMVHILTRNDAELSQLTSEDRDMMKSQAVQNMFSSIRSKMEKAMRDVMLYEQVIRVCDNILKGTYKYNTEKSVVVSKSQDTTKGDD